jgi:hypothetical protein
VFLRELDRTLHIVVDVQYERSRDEAAEQSVLDRTEQQKCRIVGGVPDSGLYVSGFGDRVSIL